MVNGALKFITPTTWVLSGHGSAVPAALRSFAELAIKPSIVPPVTAAPR